MERKMWAGVGRLLLGYKSRELPSVPPPIGFWEAS